MKNEILTSILIGKEFIKINSSQKINNDWIAIFSKEKNLANLTLGKEFLKESLNVLNKKTNSKIEEINLILDDFSLSSDLIGTESRVLSKTFKNFKNSSLNNDNYWEFQTSIKDEIENNPKNKFVKLIQLTPLKFTTKITNENTNKINTFSEFPIGEYVSEISCSFCATFMSNKYFDKIMEIFELVDVKFDINNITLLSQLSTYKFNGHVSDKLTFTFDIQDQKSMLVTSVNKIVIASNELKYSFDNLITKISKDFNVSESIVRKLIKVYCKNVFNNSSKDDLNEIIYLKNDDNKFITKKDLIYTIKSFLKSLSTEIYQIISNKSFKDIDFDINIVGKLENIKDINLYCAKYLNTENVLSYQQAYDSFINLNEMYKIHLNLIKFIEIFNGKINLNNLNQTIKKVDNKSITKTATLFKFSKKRNQNVALV